MEINQNYAPGSFPMNYLDNHDKNSYEGSIVERFGDTYQTLLALSYLTPGIPLIYTSDEMAYDHEIEFFEKDTVKWDSEPVYAPLIAALSKLKTENKALATSNTDIEFLKTDNSMLFVFTRSSGDSKVIYIGNLYYEDIKDVGVQLDFDKATCVMHHDGKTLDTEPKEMSGKDFAKRSYKPYEFYILTVD
jgi:glycosidase